MSKRNYSLPPPLLNRRTLRKFAIICFMGFIAFRILTPPQKNLYQEAPDGSQQARLKTFYYTQGIPSYKIYTRPSGTLLWKNQLYLPAYTNTPNPIASLQWSHDSQRIDLLINQTSIWHTTTF